MPNNSQLAVIQQYLTLYGMTTYTAIGNLGLLFNIAIFSRLIHRRNSCSLYLSAMSVCGFIGMNIITIPTIYEANRYDSLLSSSLYCRITFYFRHSFNQMMRTFFVLACADRYIISSNNLHIQVFRQYKIVVRVIISVILVWFSLSIFPTMLRSSVNGKCDTSNDLNAVIYSIYTAITTGILPLSSITIFNILLKINLKRMRRRVQPVINPNIPANPVLRKRDRDMLRMLLIEILCYTSTMTPCSAMLIYRSATETLPKSTDRLQIEAFIIYVTNTLLIYINNALSFWIYICVSRSFRLEFKNLIKKCYIVITGTLIRIN